MRIFGCARVAQWIRRCPPKAEIAGSSPAVSTNSEAEHCVCLLVHPTLSVVQRMLCVIRPVLSVVVSLMLSLLYAPRRFA